MTREATLALYRPMRLAIRRVTSLALKSCSRSDFLRAAKQLGPRTLQELGDHPSDEPFDMMCDIALFERNQRVRFAFNRFFAAHGRDLEPADRALASRMIATRFSLFRDAGRHEVAGVWLEDWLDTDRRLWVMDEAMKGSPPPGHRLLGIRLFDAGPFHAGFGVVALPDEETIQMAVASQRRNGRQSFRHSLAARLYGDMLLGRHRLSGTD